MDSRPSDPLDQMTRGDLLAALAWQIDMGVDEAIEATPQDRFAVLKAPARGADQRPAQGDAADPGPPPATNRPDGPEALAAGSQALAEAAQDLAALQQVMAGFEGCALKKGARNLVFADGLPGAHVMIVGEAPGRDEDREGKPFVGASGKLLDAMFAAIGLTRAAQDPRSGLYITNMLPWRPPSNRDPSTEELAMMLPFLRRHIALARPRVLVTMGNAATKSVLDTQTGITRLRGTWVEALGLPVMPMLHPAALLRDPIKKRAAWADLLAIQARLDMGP